MFNWTLQKQLSSAALHIWERQRVKVCVCVTVTKSPNQFDLGWFLGSFFLSCGSFWSTHFHYIQWKWWECSGFKRPFGINVQVKYTLKGKQYIEMKGPLIYSEQYLSDGPSDFLIPPAETRLPFLHSSKMPRLIGANTGATLPTQSGSFSSAKEGTLAGKSWRKTFSSGSWSHSCNVTVQNKWNWSC